MIDALIDLIIFIFDVLILRHIRRARGYQEHSVGEDVISMTNFYLLTIGLSVAAVAIMFMLHFWLKWPVWLSFGLPAITVGLYMGVRLINLYRNPD